MFLNESIIISERSNKILLKCRFDCQNQTFFTLSNLDVDLPVFILFFAACKQGLAR